MDVGKLEEDPLKIKEESDDLHEEVLLANYLTPPPQMTWLKVCDEDYKEDELKVKEEVLCENNTVEENSTDITFESDSEDSKKSTSFSIEKCAGWCMEDIVLDTRNIVLKKHLSTDATTVLSTDGAVSSKVNCNGKIKCSYCSKTFKFPSKLKSHLVTHTKEKLFSCTVCEKSFIRFAHLKCHLRTHTGDKPYTCTVCDKSFTRSSSLKRHMFTHPGEEIFPCTVCEKSFITFAQLKIHMRAHLGEKPFPCGVCTKSFTKSCHLKSHMLLHIGKKPFSCTVCVKSFTQATNLKMHMLTHTGEKPFSCTICSRSFTQKISLKKHVLTHTEDKGSTASTTVNEK